MNDSRVFESKRVFLVWLLDMNMPSMVIEKMLGVCEDTVRKYCKKLGRMPLSMEQAKPEILKVFADLFRKPMPLFLPKEEFRELLSEIIEEKRIIETIGLAMSGMSSFMEIQYTEEIPQGYQKLMKELFNDDNENRQSEVDLWWKYLQDISSSKITMTPQQYSREYVISSILRKYAQERRKFIAPTITIRIGKIIDGILEGLDSRDKEIVMMMYGISTDPIPWKQVIKETGLSQVRMNQIRTRLTRMIRKELSPYMRPIGSAWEEIQANDEKYHREILQIRETSAEKLLELERKYKDEAETEERYEAAKSTGLKNEELLSHEMLYKKVTEVGLKPRIVHVLYAKQVIYVWQLLEFHPEWLGNMRNLGAGSVRSVREFIEQNNLPLGVEFSPAEIEYLKAKTSNK